MSRPLPSKINALAFDAWLRALSPSHVFPLAKVARSATGKVACECPGAVWLRSMYRERGRERIWVGKMHEGYCVTVPGMPRTVLIDSDALQRAIAVIDATAMPPPQVRWNDVTAGQLVAALDADDEYRKELARERRTTRPHP